jgi:nucleotide-binding universal stress UspA family protein
MKVNSILVPLDGSALAESALPRVIALAAGTETRVILMRATEAPTFPPGDLVSAQVKAVGEAERYLAEIAARLATVGVSHVRCAVWYGAPAPAIIDAAALDHVELIVMASHGRSGLGRVVMGSVAESVLRGTTTPILLLRDAHAPLEVPTGSASCFA